MRRDLFYFIAKEQSEVSKAYLFVLKNVYKYRVREVSYSIISAKLKYSTKYNMNGGALTVHFLSNKNGTVIRYRYSIVQLFGARYQNHALDLNNAVSSHLNCLVEKCNIDLPYFEQCQRMGSDCLITKEHNNENNDSDPLEAIKQLKVLLDSGAITETEFNDKKRVLLEKIK